MPPYMRSLTKGIKPVLILKFQFTLTPPSPLEGEGEKWSGFPQVPSPLEGEGGAKRRVRGAVFQIF